MADNSPLKNVLSFVVRVGLSGALLWYIFSKIDIQKTAEVLKSADLVYIIWAGVIFLGVNFILLWRWNLFIKALGLLVSLKTIVRYFFVGLFGNLFLPSAIGGDLIKIIGVCRETHHKPKVVASVLLDRLSGFAGISLVAVISFIFGYRMINSPAVLYMILGMGAGSILIAFILFNKPMYSFCCHAFHWFPKVKAALMTMHHDIALLRGKQAEGFKAIGISCLSQVIAAFIYYLLAKGLHQDIPYHYFLIFVPIICVAASFPSIGGLGVREAGAAYLFSKIGVDAGVAVSMSLINFMFMVIVGLLGGLVYVVTLSSGRVQLDPSDGSVRQ